MITSHAKHGNLEADGISLRKMWWGQPAVYTAPLFQRRYVWGQKQFDQLWSDIDDVLSGIVSSRFLGAVVLQDISRGLPGHPAEYLIIDGQQRLTTLFVVLVAVADLARTTPAGDTLADDIATNTLINSVLQAKGSPKVAPTLQDRAQFHQVVSRLASVTLVNPAAPYGPLMGHLQQMYDKARRRIRQEMVAAARDSEMPEGPAHLAYLESVHEVVLDRLKFVVIRLGDDDDPHQVFDRLNSGGIKLKVSDLVRNEVFRRLGHRPEEALALSNGDWAQLEQSLGDRFEDFVFAYGLIKKATTTKGALLDDLRAEWQAVTPDSGMSAKEIIGDLSAYVPPFNCIAGPVGIQTGVSSRPEIVGLLSRCARLRRMPVPTSTYSFGTMVVKEAAEGRLEPTDAETCLLLVESFLVRRGFAGMEPTGLHAVFKDMWNESRGRPEAFLDKLGRHKTVAFPSDDEFAEHIRTRPVYGMKLLPYVLRVYDDAMPGDRVPDGTPLSVDHVMPQHLSGDWNVSKDEHQRLVDTWANLVPLSVGSNSKKGNLPWAVVRGRIPQESVWKSARRVAQDHLTWGPDEIEARSERLAAFALREWPRR